MYKANSIHQLFAASLTVALTLCSSIIPIVGEAHAEYRFSAGVTERTDELKWSIAGKACETCSYVDVLSELEWTGITSMIFEGTLTVDLDAADWYLAVNGGYGLITEGTVRDSDYLASGRQQEFSRSVNSSDGDDLWYLNAKVGKQIRKDSILLSPYLGYSFDQINLSITDGYQVINIDPETGTHWGTGAFSGLNSSYDASWDGYLAGCSISWLKGSWLLSGSYEYHWFNYSAEADWNLRDDFEHPVSFKHSASGEGSYFQAAIDYLISEQVAIGLSYQLREFITDVGTDTTFFSDGSIGPSRLNEVVWSSDMFGFGLKYFF